QEKVHAQDQRSFKTPKRTETRAAANRTQLRDLREYGARVFETGRGRQSRLAAGRWLGRRPPGGGAVSMSGRITTTTNQEVCAGLRRHPRATAASPPCDVAVGLGRVSRRQPGWLWLQPFLRAVSTLAQETRCGAPPTTQSRGESFRRLGRCDHADLRPRHRQRMA